MDKISEHFDALSKQYTLLSYELDRVRDVRALRQTSIKTEYEERLEAKKAALNEALRGLAKLLEL